MRVLQYNILNGCNDSDERLKNLGHWLTRKSYDIVGFNELNGWDRPPGMAKRASDWGYPFSELYPTEHSRHFVGVMSKHPIEVIEKREESFHHGLLHVLIKGDHYLITHLSPLDSSMREKEVEQIVKVVQNDEPLLLMGDLNTLSPLDAEIHGREGLLEVLLVDQSLKRKFVVDGGINYGPMQSLLDAGLEDLGAMDKGSYSVPTSYNRDKMHAAKMRLDYMLANKAFLNRSPEAHIIRDSEVDRLSDHYPIECRWG